MIFLKLFFCILLFLIIPVMVGGATCGILKIDRSLENCMLYGIMLIWALFQLISVPLIIMKRSFLLVVILSSVALIVLIIISIYKSYYPDLSFLNIKGRKFNIGELLGVILAVVSMAIVLYFSITLQHTDADDSRFGVNIVDILRTHRMFITIPATGEILGTWEGEVSRDVVSPWAVFVAYCSYLTHIHPTIMFHTIIPIALYIYIYMVYWIISGKLIKDGLIYRGVFIFVLTLVNIYGYASTYVAEARVMVRVWQGKTVVSGLCIPLLIYLFIDIYEEGIDKGRFILLLIVETAMCFLSGMGILIGAIMVGGYGLVYAVLKKDWKMGLKMWITALPCIIFYGVSLII